MLKRQRPSSPVFFPDEVDTAATDLYEPDSKRRRYFASPSFPSVGKQGVAQANDADSDDGDERENAWSEHSARKPEWHMAAGAYKDANTLLHDLHAEQRHRALFSPSYRPSSSNAAHNAYSSPYSHPRPTLETSKDHTSSLSDPSTGPPLNYPLPPASYAAPSHNDGLQMGYDGTFQSTDHSEAEMVTQRYEDSNRYVTLSYLGILTEVIDSTLCRFLRALFLSRRREIEGHDQIQ